MNPWQAERLAATYGEEQRRGIAAKAALSTGRRPLPRTAAALTGQLLVRVGRRLLEVGGAAQGPPARRRADVC